MTIRLHRGDLPDLSRYSDIGGDRYRDHGPQSASRPAVRGAAVERRRQRRRRADRRRARRDAPNLKALLANPAITKIFHFARFDLAVLYNAFGVMPQPVYCTKIASRLTRTYTDRHGLKDLVREVLNIDLSKQQQSSDWGAAKPERGAARLRRLRRAASARAARASSTRCWRARAATELAQACFDFLPTRARLDLGGWEAEDIFAHS